MPSFASSLWNSCCCSSRSSVSPLSNGTSAPDCTARLIRATVRGVAVARRGSEVGGGREAVEGFVRMQAEEILVAGGDAGQVGDGRPRREELIAVPAQHEHVDVVVEARLQDRFIQVAHHLK